MQARVLGRLQQALRAQGDGGQRGVDLVGDAGRELADVGQAAGALHALLLVAAVAHVLEDDHEPCRRAPSPRGEIVTSCSPGRRA